MYKKGLSIFLLNLSAILFSYACLSHTPANLLPLEQLKYNDDVIVIGHINTSFTDTIKLIPDTVQFTITDTTEANTLNDASNRNAENMAKLNSYLHQLGVQKVNLATVAYQNYQKDRQQLMPEQPKRYSSKFIINITATNEQFLKVVKLLDENNINDIKQYIHDSYYIFSIEEIADSADKAKSLALSKYQQMSKSLTRLGVKNISIAGYDNQLIKPAKELVKRYFVTNTLSITVNDFNLVGQIIAKAQELKMMVNNDINYSVSDIAKDRILAEHEQMIYNKLVAKATRLLGQQYQLGVPVSLDSHETSKISQLKSPHDNYSEVLVSSVQTDFSELKNIEIQPPADFSITLTMSGKFEVVKIINN